MRITIDLDESQLKQIQAVTGMKKKSPAVGKALQTYLREMTKKRILRMVKEGRTDYSTSNKELERRAMYDPD